MSNAHLSIWHLIWVADPVVKFVMLILLMGSILSWTIIFQRNRMLRLEKNKLKIFEKRFWSGQNLSELYQSVRNDTSPNGAELVFANGYKELSKLERKQGLSGSAIMAGIERAMRVCLTRETSRLQQGLSLLATIGSVSPYVGLFGTVWGIMNAFQSLGSVQQATLAMVAPGISEALIATAMGLFVAIPAVIAYNRFVARSEELISDYENVAEEFSVIVHREVHSSGDKA